MARQKDTIADDKNHPKLVKPPRGRDYRELSQEEIEEVIKYCKHETRISYEFDDSFFTPQMRSINYLEVGRSPIISSPLAIMLEWLFVQYKRARDWFRAFCKWLFPRRDVIWRDHIDSHLVGQTVLNATRGSGAPAHHLHLEYWARTWWGSWRKLSQGRSDKDGNFRLGYDLRQARDIWVRSLQFEIHTTKRVYFHQENPKLHFDLWHRQKLSKSDQIGMDYNLRTIGIDFWRYRPDCEIPRALVNEDETSPEKYDQGREDALIQQVTPYELIKAKHLIQLELKPGTLTIQEIQKDYPENLTVCIEKYLPGYTRSDAWFARRMMNGMNRACFQRDLDNKNHYWVKYFGRCWYKSNNVYALPDAEMCFEIDQDALPRPVSIRLTGRLSLHDKDEFKSVTIDSHENERWEQAKRVARVSGAFNTEVEEHFTGTHLNTEQYAIACNRNFRLNPLAALLMPHMKEVSLIDHLADSVLISGYIPTATALTEQGIEQRCRDVLGMQDWKNWQPMKPVNEAHTCAKAETLFWTIIREYVDHFFSKNQEAIQKHWYEVYCFSNDLVNHAVPIAFTASKNARPDGEQWSKLAQKRFDYYCQQYGFDPALERPVIDGETKAISRITSAQVFDQAGPEDWENIKQACCYAIMMATYMHTWINEHQHDDIGEILYSSLGLRFGEKPSGIMAPETDHSIAPDLVRSTQMLFFSNLLSRTEYGFITKNEEGDVNPWLINMLKSKREQFKDLGVEVDAIESRTNI